MKWLAAQVQALGTILAALGRADEYDAEALRAWRRRRLRIRVQHTMVGRESHD